MQLVNQLPFMKESFWMYQQIELEWLKRKVVLLIEKDYPGQKPQTHSCGIPMNNIDTALRNCEVKNGYLVERTDGEKQSIIFLSVYMQKIIGLFKVSN